MLKQRLPLFFGTADKADFPVRKIKSHRNFYQNTLIQLLLDKLADDAGNAETDLCKTDEQIHGGNLQNMAQLQLMLFQLCVDRLTGDIFLIQHHEGSCMKERFIGEQLSLVSQILLRSYKGVIDAQQRTEVIAVQLLGRPMSPRSIFSSSSKRSVW